MTSRVVVVGDIMMDVIVTLAEEMQRGSDATSSISTTFGGVGANVASWLGYQNVPCNIVSVVGDDPWGTLIVQHLQSLGVETNIDVAQEVPTGIVVALAHPDGERSMFPDSRANQLLTHRQFPDSLWQGTSWLSMSGYTLLQPATRELGLHVMRMARHHGVKVALDPASSAPISQVPSSEVDAWFAETDLLLPNEQELQVLAPHHDWRESLLQLGQRVPVVIAKRGAQGSAICEAGVITEIPARPAHVVDTVGAGDAFAAGTIAALSRGENIVMAATHGSRIATLALNARGAQPDSRGL